MGTLCTCDLETDFGCASNEDGTWDVFDAECVPVAVCPSERMARMIVGALNEAGERLGDILVCYDQAPDHDRGFFGLKQTRPKHPDCEQRFHLEEKPR